MPFDDTELTAATATDDTECALCRGTGVSARGGTCGACGSRPVDDDDCDCDVCEVGR